MIEFLSGLAMSIPFQLKMVDAITKGFGASFRLLTQVRQAEAEAESTVAKAQGDAEATIIEANAKAEVALIETQGKIDVADLKRRAKVVAEYREVAQQKNWENIIRKAIPFYIKEVEDGNYTDELVDSEFMHEFVDSCKHKEDEDIQTLWAKILAREVAIPGSFSLLTMSTLKVMRKSEAELFTKICSYVWKHNEEPILIVNPRVKYGNEPRVNYYTEDELVYLDTYGLLQYGVMKYNIGGAKEDEFIYFGEKFDVKETSHSIVVKSIATQAILTSVGLELYAIAGSVENMEYKENMLVEMGNQGFTVTRMSQP